MRMRLVVLALFCFSFSSSYAQKSVKWEDWKWLTGYWEGEGSGQPGMGEGNFSFFFDLDSNVLVRRSHSSYPASANRKETIHNDIMIVYPGNEGIPSKAVYFDNEGHTIFYNVSTSHKTIVFTSEKESNLPCFRLIYTQLENGLVNTKFEMSQDGQKFMMYIEGNSKRAR